MSGWTSKYLVDGDHSFKGKNSIDFIPEDLFFRTLKEQQERNEDRMRWFKWENVEAHYSVIKLRWPWQETVDDYPRKKQLKTTHAICLNGIPIFQLSSKSEDGKKVWEWETYREPQWDISSKMKEEIIGDTGGAVQSHKKAIDDLRMKYHEIASPDFGGSPEKVLAHQSSYSLKDYKKWDDSNDNSGFPSRRLNMTINAFLWKREQIITFMGDVASSELWAKKCGFPNLFYERVINPYTYPSDMNQSNSNNWDDYSLKEQKMRKKKFENPDNPSNEQMTSFRGVIQFVLHSLSKIGGCEYYNNSPKRWKRVCRFLNVLSKREWMRGQGNLLGIVNHTVLGGCPMLTVEQGTALIGATSKIMPNHILPILNGEDEDTASSARRDSGIETNKWWAGMLLNGFNYYSTPNYWCFTDQSTKIRRHIPWSGQAYSISNQFIWDYVETDMVKKTNKYPPGASSSQYGVLPPFVNPK
jgi:hypothetical protein